MARLSLVVTRIRKVAPLSPQLLRILSTLEIFSINYPPQTPREDKMFDYGQNSFNTCDTAAGASDERSEIIAWLSPLEPGTRHRALQTDRVPNVGDWLLQTEVFQSWSDVSRQDESGGATMFCYGDPGVGKTYIT